MRPKGEILVVDDERTMLVTLSLLLEDAGYRVRTARDGASALSALAERKSDLVLLDVMMPGMDGFAVCRRIRETDVDTPILFLTALADEESQLEGFGCGADDYLPKTLSEPLFLARVAAALRRTQADDGASFAIGAWTVRSDEYAMSRADGSRVALTDREIALLRLFAMHPREVLSRDFLLAQGWGSEATVTDGVLNVAVSFLRKKLGADGERIVSVRGVGYAYHP